MQMFETELADARALLAAAGHAPEDVTFDVKHQAPDPDDDAGGGMFTARYEVVVTDTRSGNARTFLGGIGLAWVRDFAAALERGEFG